MGQQQLLLIALSVIIVGAAVAVGVNMLSEGQRQAELDSIYQRGTMLAPVIAEEYGKPESMGGLGNDYNNISGSNPTAKCEDLGIAENDDATTINSITAAASDSLVVEVNHQNSSASGTFAIDGGGNINWTTEPSH